MGSRMSREVHVRFCEGLGVRFPRATLLPGSPFRFIKPERRQCLGGGLVGNQIHQKRFIRNLLLL